MPEIDRPFDAADDDHESVEPRYEDEGCVLRNVWGEVMKLDKIWCRTVALDDEGRPVPRPQRQIDELRN